MRIGRIEFDEPFISLAPLAGYGDVAFRDICREWGASLTVTEMISAKGLCYGNEKTESMLRLAHNENPSCVQLFGSDPEFFRRAVLHPALARFDIIDINMGCPVPKVTKCREGGALIKHPSLAAEIVSACVESAGGRSVTVKHRIGFGEGENSAARFAQEVVRAGAAAVTVHGRTVAQGYGGKADWDAIAEVVGAVSVPVIGNGDISSREQAIAAMEKYGCAGVAVGRGALGSPWIFSENKCGSVREAILRHLDKALAYFPERLAVLTMRKHIAKYLAGVSGTKTLRVELYAVETADELREKLRVLP